MTKPDKPLEAQGMGCGLLISIVVMTYGLSSCLGLSAETSLWIAGGLAALSLVAYMINQHKAEQILDREYEDATAIRDEVPCKYCAEPILRRAKKCKHCGEMQ